VPSHLPQDVRRRLEPIRLLVLDVDGVLTDGSLFYGDDGEEYRAFNSKDGHGMVMLRENSVRIGIITGRTSEVVRIRMESMGIEHVFQGHFERFGDLRLVEPKIEIGPHQGNDRGYAVAGDGDVVVQIADDLHVAAGQADLLLRLPQGGVSCPRVGRLQPASRKTYLTGMMGQMIGPAGE